MCPNRSYSDSQLRIATVTSCSKSLYEQQVFGRCLDTWHQLSCEKYLLSEDGLELDGFYHVDLAALCDQTGYLTQSRSKGTVRFYKKALAIYWALTNLDHDMIVWLDSDVEILGAIACWPVLRQPIATMFYPAPHQNDQHIANGGVDTGMILFDKRTLPSIFADDYIGYWHTDRLHELTKPKDTFVLLDLIGRYPMQNLMQSYQPLPSGSNYFDQTVFKGLLHHYIGRGNK